MNEFKINRSSAQDYSGVKGLVDIEKLDVPANLVGHVYDG